MKLTAQQLEHVERALDYIEAHLNLPVRVEEISQHVGYSLFHFCRIFNAATYISPYTYLMRRRISEAALQIIHSKRRLTDIAVDFGFQSSEVFGRSIKRLFGLLPSELRKAGVLDPRLILPALTLDKLSTWQKFQGYTMKKEEVPAFTLSGVMTRWDGSPLALERCHQSLHQGANQSPSAGQVGVRFFPDHWPVDGMFFFTGHEFPAANRATPEWFVEKTFAAQSLLVTSSGVDPVEIEALLDFYQCVWFPTSSYRVDVPFLLEKTLGKGQVQIAWPAQPKTWLNG